MYASQIFKADSEARVIVKMLHAVDCASHSIASAFGLGSKVFLSSDELVAQAEENLEYNVSHCDFSQATSSDEFNRYWTGGGTAFAWRVWEAGSEWHAEAQISHPSGTFTSESTLLWACERAGFTCEEVSADYRFHENRASQERLASALSAFTEAHVNELRVPYTYAAWQAQFLANVRAYADMCERVFEERKRRDDDKTAAVFEDEPGAEELLGESTLAKLRRQKLDFDNE